MKIDMLFQVVIDLQERYEVLLQNLSGIEQSDLNGDQKAYNVMLSTKEWTTFAEQRMRRFMRFFSDSELEELTLEMIARTQPGMWQALIAMWEFKYDKSPFTITVDDGVVELRRRE